MNNLKSKRIKTLLVVGLGSIGKKHIRILKSFREDISVVALTSRPSDFIDDPLIFRAVDTLDKAVALAPDAAIVCNPASYHMDVSIPLALKSIPLLIEKPLSESSSTADKLFKAIDYKNSLVMVGYNLRFSESLRMFRNLIKSKEIGKIYSVRSSVGQDLTTWRPDQDYRKSVSSNKSLGGGVLLELSHEIDYLSWIFGPIRSVFGYSEKVSDLEVDVEDISHSLIRFKEGLQHNNLVANLSLDFIRQDSTRYCIAIGERGTLIWDGIKGSVKIFQDGNWKVLFKDAEKPDSSYEEELHHFLDCVENSKTPLIELESSINVLKVIEAIKLSSEKNEVVNIDLN